MLMEPDTHLEPNFDGLGLGLGPGAALDSTSSMLLSPTLFGVPTPQQAVPGPGAAGIPTDLPRQGTPPALESDMAFTEGGPPSTAESYPFYLMGSTPATLDPCADSSANMFCQDDAEAVPEAGDHALFVMPQPTATLSSSLFGSAFDAPPTPLLGAGASSSASPTQPDHAAALSSAFADLYRDAQQVPAAQPTAHALGLGTDGCSDLGYNIVRSASACVCDTTPTTAIMPHLLERPSSAAVPAGEPPAPATAKGSDTTNSIVVEDDDDFALGQTPDDDLGVEEGDATVGDEEDALALMAADTNALLSPTTNSPPSPTEAVQIGGRLRKIPMDAVRAIVQDYHELLLRSREQCGCSHTSTSTALGYKIAQTKQLLRGFYNERIAHLPRMTQICIAYTMLRGAYNEEKNSGVVILARNARALNEGHLRELAEIVDANVRDWVSCDSLAANVLFVAMKRGAAAVTSVLEWRNAGSAWRQRCCCMAFAKLLRQTGTQYVELVPSLCASCLQSSERPLQTAVGTLLRELCAVDEARCIAVIRDNIQHMSPDCLRMASEKLSEAGKAHILSLRKSADAIPTTTTTTLIAPTTTTKTTATALMPTIVRPSQLPSVIQPTASAPAPLGSVVTLVPARGGASPAPRRKKRAGKSKTKPNNDGPLLISPSASPATGSPDLATPVPVPAAGTLRRSYSVGRFPAGRDALIPPFFGESAAAVGASIARTPSTPQHQTTSTTPHTSLTPALSAMALSAATTPTKKRTRAAYRTNVSPALLAQNPTSATLAAAVAASASAANLGQCAPVLSERKLAPPASVAAASAAATTTTPALLRQAQLQQQQQSQQQQLQLQIQLQLQLQLQQQQKQLRGTKSAPMQQVINAQRKQMVQQHQHHLGHGRGGAAMARSGTRLMQPPKHGAGNFVRPYSPSKRK